MFWFFLPTLAAAGLFSDHIQRYVNNKTEPCDDFYDHVCTAEMKESDFYGNKVKKRLKIVLDQLTSPEFRQFELNFMNDLVDFPDVSMEQNDLEAYKELTGNFSCWYSNITQFVERIALYDGVFRWQSTSHYAEHLIKIRQMFKSLKKILIEEFSKAIWTERHSDLLQFLRTVELVDLTAKDLHLESETAHVKQRYEKCLGISSNKTQLLAKKCMQYALCPIHEKIFKNTNDFIDSLFWDGIAFTENAAYLPSRNIVILGLAYDSLEEDDLPYLFGAVAFTLAHELGHVFFGKARPLNSVCFKQHMLKTCNRFRLDPLTECLHYESGKYLRFGDDASDWVGVYGGLKALTSYYPEASEEELNKIVGQFFYANAVNWCSSDPGIGSRDHSSSKMRVNGIASLFSEFSHVFQCKRGSKMAKAATCLPFAGVGAPTRKRTLILP